MLPESSSASSPFTRTVWRAGIACAAIGLLSHTTRAAALGYEEFTLNWLTPANRLVSARIEATSDQQVLRDASGGIAGVTATFASKATAAGACTLRFDDALRCSGRAGPLANAAYVWIAARQRDDSGRGILAGEAGRIYKRFMAAHRGKGLADGHFECVERCTSAPRWIVLVWLGD